MPAGDLIVRDGQYEFNGILFNDHADGDAVKMITTQGLFDLPDVKTHEVDSPEDHGGSIARSVFTMRRIILQFTVLATTKELMYSKTKAIAAAFQPREYLMPLVWQRPSIGKQFINVKAAKFSGFDSGWEKEMGQTSASAMLTAPDPRKLAFVQSSQALTIPVSGTTVSDYVVTTSDFVGGAKPILEIAGPVTNPRISNAADSGRTIRIDVVVQAGQTLILDFSTRSATIGGVDQAVRTDNQWWVLQPGSNFITFLRSNAPANTGVLTIKWWNSFA